MECVSSERERERERESKLRDYFLGGELSLKLAQAYLRLIAAGWLSWCCLLGEAQSRAHSMLGNMENSMLGKAHSAQQTRQGTQNARHRQGTEHTVCCWAIWKTCTLGKAHARQCTQHARKYGCMLGNMENSMLGKAHRQGNATVHSRQGQW